MTTALISGAGGFLGSHILEATLRRTDWDVVVVDSFRHNGGTDRLLHAMADGATTGDTWDSVKARVRLITHDLTAPFSPQQADQIGHLDYVVHAAAQSSVDHSIQDPAGHIRNNVESTLSVLQLATDYDYGHPERYLHISTDEVFGHGIGVAEPDGDMHRPSSPYAASKAACEDITNAWRTSFGLKASIVNSQNLFGPRQSMAAFIPKVISAILDGREIPIHIDSATGEAAWRWYTYAPNLAAWVVDELLSRLPLPRYLIPGQMGINVHRLAESVSAMVGEPLRARLISGEAARSGGFDHKYNRLPETEGSR